MKAYSKDIVRTISKGKKRFLAIMIITILGVTMFSGLKAGCVDLRNSGDAFFDKQNLHDLYLLSTLGFTDDDINALKNVEGIKDVEGGYFEEANVKTKKGDLIVQVTELSKKGYDCPYVTEGRMPKYDKEMLLSREFATKSDAKIGDYITTKVDDKLRTYEVVGIATDITSINNPDGTTAFRNSSAAKDKVFVKNGSLEHDIYTFIMLYVDGAKGLFSFSDEYKELVGSTRDTINNDIKTDRENARYNQVYNDALKEINDAQVKADNELADGLEKLVNAGKELEDGRKELDSAWNTIESSRSQIDSGKAEIEKNKNEIYDNLSLIDSGIVEIERNKNDLVNQKNALIVQRKAVIDELEANGIKEDEIDDNLQQLENLADLLNTENTEMQQFIRTEIDRLKEAKSDPTQLFAEIDEMVRFLNTLIDSIEPEDSEIRQYMIGVRDRLLESKSNIDVLYEEIEETLQFLENLSIWIDAENTEIQQYLKSQIDGLAEAKNGLSLIDEGLAQIDEGLATIDSKKVELSENKKLLEDGLAVINEKENDLVAGEKELQNGLNEYYEGKAKIDDAEKKLADGWAEYLDGKKEAEDKINDARNKLKDISKATWYVQERTALSGYSSVESDADSIEAIGTAFPIVFFIVAILISLTTITRMVEEDRGLIGTYKALGLTNFEIRRKFGLYSFMASMCGAIVGSVMAFVVMPNFLFFVFNTMYLIPKYYLSFVPLHGVLAVVIFVGGIYAATMIACRSELGQTPAALMRPKTPKAGSRVFLEYIKPIWNRMSFLDKVTARNLFRYKKRMIMTIFGIAGCMALLIFGFAVKDSVSALLPKQYADTYKFGFMVTGDTKDNDKIKSYLQNENVAEYIDCEMTSADVDAGGDKNINLTVYVIPDEADFSKYVNLRDLNGEELSLKSGDVYVTRNAGEVVGFEKSDEINVQLLNLESAKLKVTSMVENYVGNNIYMTRSTFLQYFTEYEQNGMLGLLSDKCDDYIKFTKDLSAKDGVITCFGIDDTKNNFDEAFQLINAVVYVVIAMSAALAFVVLFTLSTTNISERERELATIKVLGFYNKEVYLYVDKETLILTVIGIAIGVPLGNIFAGSLTTILNLPSIYLDTTIDISSYVISGVLSFVFALVVNLITDRTLDKIDPVTALKSVE